MCCPTELWLPIIDGGWYEISSCGRVRAARTGRILRPYHRGHGYLAVRIAGSRQRYVHRLVAAAFCGTPQLASDHVDHLDFNVENNHAVNLRWLAAHLNQGRQVRWGVRGWERVADELAPEGHVPLSPEQRSEIDDHLAQAGF